MAVSESGAPVIDPMKQFEVKSLFGGGYVESALTITNSTLWMAVCLLAISGLLIYGMRGRALVPTRIQSCAELLYTFIRSMVMDVMGEEGRKFFPYVFTLFIFILFSNLIGMIPGSFTVTSHLAVTGILAMAVFLSVIVIGFSKNGVGFLKLFWVDSAPLALRPILALIELISFFVRPVSHSLRLAGNMMAGHAVLKVFAGLFSTILFAGLGPLAILPMLMMVAITGLEFLVACVQAYIFAILTCIYLNDALHPGH
ncbi:MAG: F0F1 ATP synthase subunit A [Pseudomonadota bacterium]